MTVEQDINRKLGAILEFIKSGGLDPKITLSYASELPTASADTMNKIYFVPIQDGTAPNTSEEYITKKDGNNYVWELIGNTSVDLSAYSPIIEISESAYNSLQEKDYNTVYLITD